MQGWLQLVAMWRSRGYLVQLINLVWETVPSPVCMDQCNINRNQENTEHHSLLFCLPIFSFSLDLQFSSSFLSLFIFWGKGTL